MEIRNLVERARSLRRAGQIQQAEQFFRQVLGHDPKLAGAIEDLAELLYQTGRLADAEQLLRRAVTDAPDNASHCNNLGNVLAGMKRLDEAAAAYRQAIRLDPHNIDAHFNLGNLLLASGRGADAVDHFRIVADADPSALAWDKLGLSLRMADRLDDAADACRRAVQIDPQNPVFHNNLANMLKDQGLVDDAIAGFRRAVQLKPDYVKAHSNLVYTLHYSPSVTPAQALAENIEWARRHADPLTTRAAAHRNCRDAARRLRVGYVSPNFRSSALSMLLEPILQNHDRHAFEIFCYSDCDRPDDTTARIRSLAHAWRESSQLSDGALAEMIRTDAIDVLVDLSLHMANNRMLVFARRPAPVQISYLAYPASGGMRAIDYLLTDPHLDPPGQCEHCYVERLHRLPHTYWCYPDQPDSPTVGPLPARSSGHITFGTLNNICKTNPPVAGLWAQVLSRVPGSRLAVLVAGGAQGSPTLLGMLRHAGIDPARIDVFARCPRRQYLDLFNRIDISLDTLPYNGHTTSLDSLWMGVPVVTVAGSCGVTRGGVSVLNNVGLPELIAQTPDQYIDIAVRLCGDLPGLEALRAGLRQRMRSSPLMDAPAAARGVEQAYRTIWSRWCETDQP
jgi:predicted O-linked N-acetylglucosamine transferase (SPINDLY family)